MSKSTFENIIRALVGIPVQQLGVYLDTIQKVQKSGAHVQLAAFNKTVVAAAVAEEADELGRFDVGRDGSFKVKVVVNRSQTAMQAFKGITSHHQFFDDTVLAEMPLGEGEEVTLTFFPIKKQLRCTEYATELKIRGLKPDPMAQVVHNERYPDFSKEFPNGTQWENKAGNFCYAIWHGWDGDRGVRVYRFSGAWNDCWFACGVSE